ncbi:MAG: TlpA family protein disulfide reductase [Bacillaceae bacterium]|nr:TlpA family protein disulfide reductase [Bacillaceae bacterium]
MTRKNAGYLMVFSFMFLVLGVIYAHSDTTMKQVEQQVIATNKYGVQKGDIATNLKLMNQKGEAVSLSDYRGRKIVLNFFVTWCGPCQEEMPTLVNLHNNNEYITVIGINLSTQEKDLSQVDQFIKHFQIEYDVLYDGEGLALEEYQLIGTPTTLFIDENAKIVERINGMITESLLKQHSFFKSK